PFAAILFVLETLMGIVALDALLPLIAATALATALTRAIVGAGPIYGSRQFALQSPIELIAYGVLGAAAAVVGEIFKRRLAWTESLAARRPVARPWRAMLGGLMVGTIAAVVPYVVGNGFEALNLVVDGRLAVPVMLVLLVAKIAATSGSVA